MARHTTRRLTSAAFGLALVGASGIAFAGSANADPNPNITICHATGNPDKWVVLTIDAAAITQQGHDQHQDNRDVIPPFEYISENQEEPVSYAGQNWDDNWETNGEGVATGEVTKDDCDAPEEPSVTPTPTPTVTVTPTPTPTVTVTPTPTTSTPPVPTGPVVETDLVESGGTNVGLLGAGAALLLAGAAASTVVVRRRGNHI